AARPARGASPAAAASARNVRLSIAVERIESNTHADRLGEPVVQGRMKALESDDHVDERLAAGARRDGFLERHVDPVQGLEDAAHLQPQRSVYPVVRLAERLREARGGVEVPQALDAAPDRSDRRAAAPQRCE